METRPSMIGREKKRRVNITLYGKEIEIIDGLARKLYMSRSEYIGWVAKSIVDFMKASDVKEHIKEKTKETLEAMAKKERKKKLK